MQEDKYVDPQELQACNSFFDAPSKGFSQMGTGELGTIKLFRMEACL
jgi:hypothetical protein